MNNKNQRRYLTHLESRDKLKTKKEKEKEFKRTMQHYKHINK
jgi:hypothetical protein